MKHVTTISPVAALLAADTAFASVDTLPRPGGVYRLKRHLCCQG